MLKTEIIDGLPMEAYLERDAISHGAICAAYEGPEFYKEYIRHTRAKKESSAMRMGSALHLAVSDYCAYQRDYVVKPEGLDLRTKRGREVLESLDVTGKSLLSYDEAYAVTGMYTSIMAHPVASRLIREGVFERSYFWSHKGLRFRARPDIINGNSIFEIKTTDDVREAKVTRTIESYGYHVQAYMQCLAAGVTDFVWIFVRSSPPHIVRLYHPTEDTLLLGKEVFSRAVEVIRAGNESGKWTCPDESIQPITIRRW